MDENTSKKLKFQREEPDWTFSIKEEELMQEMWQEMVLWFTLVKDHAGNNT